MKKLLLDTRNILLTLMLLGAITFVCIYANAVDAKEVQVTATVPACEVIKDNEQIPCEVIDGVVYFEEYKVIKR